MPSPSRTRLSGELVAANGKLYLAGRSSPADGGELEPNPSIEVYDPATGTWSVLIDELPIPIPHMRMLAWRDRLLFYTANVESPGAIHLVVVRPPDASAASRVISNPASAGN
jgi:hypothetical protein